MLQYVSDNLGVVEALAGRGSPAIIIGHDWGAPIASCSALLRPDIFTAVAMLSVPYSPPGGRRPTDAFAEMGRRACPDEEFYISYFQEPGRAEREAEIDVRSWLLGFYVAASADGARPGVRRREHRHRDSRHDAPRPLSRPRPASRLAHRGRPGVLHRGVRTDRFSGSPQPVPQCGQGLAGPPAMERRAHPVPVPSLSEGRKTARPCGGPGPSPVSPTPCRTCGAATSSPGAVTGSSRNGPMRSTGSSWTG